MVQFCFCFFALFSQFVPIVNPLAPCHPLLSMWIIQPRNLRLFLRLVHYVYFIETISMLAIEIFDYSNVYVCCIFNKCNTGHWTWTCSIRSIQIRFYSFVLAISSQNKERCLNINSVRIELANKVLLFLCCLFHALVASHFVTPNRTKFDIKALRVIEMSHHSFSRRRCCCCCCY